MEGNDSGKKRDPRITYRGENPGRLDNLTDAVFGIAITLLIFNLIDPNSFQDLLTFTKTLPAFFISVAFLILIWYEHKRFSQVYGLHGPGITFLNTIFITLVIFYVYPLRFLTLFLTNFFFRTNVKISIPGDQVPNLTIYYGLIVFALYFTLFLFYWYMHRRRDIMKLNEYEVFYTKMQIQKQVIMFFVPLVSVTIVFLLKEHSIFWASVLGGNAYFFYTPLMIYWAKKFEREARKFTTEQGTETEPVIES